MEVAVGMDKLASMFSTIRTAPPRMGWAMSPGRIAGMATAFDRSRAETAAGSWRTRVPLRADSFATTAPRPLAPSPPFPRGGGSGSGETPRALSK